MSKKKFKTCFQNVVFKNISYSGRHLSAKIMFSYMGILSIYYDFYDDLTDELYSPCSYKDCGCSPLVFAYHIIVAIGIYVCPRMKTMLKPFFGE